MTSDAALPHGGAYAQGRVACEFCEKMEPSDREWFDFHILHADADFITVACLGAIVPGYLMILPRQHTLSMASVTAAEHEGLATYLQFIASVQAQAWAYPTIFEHGSCGQIRSGVIGSCISHAHWPLVPGDFALAGGLAGFRTVSSIREIRSVPRPDGYLMYWNSEGIFVNTTDHPPSQYFRHILSSRVGLDDQWDYLVFPFLDNVRETIDRFQEVASRNI